ncbi:MAG: PAS domain S-box protein [Salinivirgaceae bacterium]|nr:PAS domain S-box protein [Salinivirgaceae bacterium]
MYQILKELGENTLAISYLELYKEIKDSVDNTTKLNKAEDLSLRLYIRHKQKEYNELIKENEIQFDKITNQISTISKQRRYIIVFAILIFFLSISVVYIVYLFFQKKRTNRLLMLRNTVIENQKHEILQQKDYLSDANKELEKMSIIAEKTNNAVSIIDSEGFFVWVNNGFTKMYGYTLDEFKVSVSPNLFEASDHPHVNEKMRMCRTKKIPVKYDFLANCKNNKTIWAHTTLTPLVDLNGEVYQYIAIDTDISELKNAEEKIRNQHSEITHQANDLLHVNEELEKLSIIAQKTSNSVILIDHNGLIEWVNNSFTQIYGFSLSEVKGREYKQLVKEYFSLDIKKLVNVWFGTKIPVSFESLNNTKSKGKIWVNTSLTPILDNEGNVLKMVVIDSDITALKKAEQELKKINEDITASISYAQRIQMAFMPKVEKLHEYFAESFVYFKPRNIVSGDFYWFEHYKNKTIVVAADCTGHGVPGAFMSLIGIASLDKIVKEKNITKADLLLYQLRLSIIDALGQKGEIGEASDGMDVSVAIFDRENRTINLAGAMTTMFVFKNHKLMTIKGDRISIGYDQVEKGFNAHNLPLDKGDVVYLFTDGILDQFGGEKNEKLKLKGLKEFIGTIKEDPMKKQEIKLKNFLLSWQGKNSQLDDILFMALKY